MHNRAFNAGYMNKEAYSDPGQGTYQDIDLQKKFANNFDSSMERVAQGRSTVSTLGTGFMSGNKDFKNTFASGNQRQMDAEAAPMEEKEASENPHARAVLPNVNSLVAFQYGYTHSMNKEALSWKEIKGSIGGFYKKHLKGTYFDKPWVRMLGGGLAGYLLGGYAGSPWGGALLGAGAGYYGGKKLQEWGQGAATPDITKPDAAKDSALKMQGTKGSVDQKKDPTRE